MQIVQCADICVALILWRTRGPATTPPPPPSPAWWRHTRARPPPSSCWPPAGPPLTWWASTSPTVPSWRWRGSTKWPDSSSCTEAAFLSSMRRPGRRGPGWTTWTRGCSTPSTSARGATSSPQGTTWWSSLAGGRAQAPLTPSEFCEYIFAEDIFNLSSSPQFQSS